MFYRTWGSTQAEREKPCPCDRYVDSPDDAYFRAVDVDAPASVLFRWLCQMKEAPYSYDWIDNSGRLSPRQWTPGMEHLEVGQRVMYIFRLEEFEQDRHLTILLNRPDAVPVFGNLACTYSVIARSDSTCRLLVKLIVRYPRRGLWRLMRWLLPWGDWLMMRKQLLTFKRLAEQNRLEANR